MKLNCASQIVDLNKPVIMGVLNVTPDSFFDGGRRHVDGSLNIERVLDHAKSMVAQGAEIIDIGGESTRPGAEPVSLEEEKRRVLPVVEALAAELNVVLSVDTSQAEIISEAARLGAGLINDVRALAHEDTMRAAAESDLPVCLMHMQGQPQTMQNQPKYQNVVEEVTTFFRQKIKDCASFGIDKERLVLDPGIGFGKTDEHNLALINGLESFKQFELPVLFGVSRKSMIGRLLNRDLEQRLPGSLAFALLALQRGANILRVHDVAETKDIVEVFQLTKK